MTAQIPRSKRIVGGPGCEQFSSGAVISPAQAETVRKSANSKTKMIPNDFPLAEELIQALVEYRVLTQAKKAELTLDEVKNYFSELDKAIYRLEQVSSQMGEFVFGHLYKNGAFGNHSTGRGDIPRSDAIANKSAFENELRSWRDASTAAQSQLEGVRPRKRYEMETAVRLLADVYEKGSGSNASAKDYEDTPFMRFTSSALPLFELSSRPGYVVRRILHKRKRSSFE